ncbi:hypothetical protein ScPMuIL_001000 [Solemya velum]
MCGRQASGFVIQSLDGSCTLESPCLIECNDLPSNRSEIPSPTVAENYSHLADIAPQIPTIDDGVEIELLLGRDLVCAHHVLEQRISGDMLPFGQRLPLGWVIIGNVCLGQAHLPEQVNVRKTTVFANGRPSYLEPCESELTVKEDPIFKRVPGDEKPGLSLEDKRFLDIMRTGFQRTTSGHWEAPMPFKENRPFLPDNKRMALKRAKSFDISLSSNPDKRRKPFTICGKLLLREMMSVTTSNEWDDPLPESLYGKWCTWVDSMHHLGNLSIPRAYCDISFADALKREVLVFADASKDVIAAVAYLKLYDADRSKIGFLLGKAKLAPTHGHTIPRLELCAAVLATEIAEIVRDQLDIQRDAFQFFSDSQVVLGYISNESRRFYIYVGNRVSKIRLFSKPSQWSFVHSECNPADIATRGLDASSLSQSKWILGPDIEQTTSDNFDLVDPDNDKEIRPEVRCFKLEHSEENTEHLVGRTKQSEDITDSSEDKVERSAEISEVFSERFSRFSDWRKLVRVVARIKFLATSVRKDRKCLAERFDEPRLLQESERVIIKLAQHDAFSTELKCIYEGKDIPHSSSLGILCPFIDANGQLRVGGRLNKISDDNELLSALETTKETSHGADKVQYTMLKNLPDSCIPVLLELYNRVWVQQSIPSSWKRSFIVPIRETGKDTSSVSLYRPIAMTSCLCKLMERMAAEPILAVRVYYSDGGVGSKQRGSKGRRVALITGITGQDGSYLAEFLINKGYEVHGIIRRSSSFNTGRIEHLYANPVAHTQGAMILHYGDLTDSTNLVKIIRDVRPHEIYNLGAQSHVKVSFEMAEYTANVDALGTLRLLDAIRTCDPRGDEQIKFYQASTSEMYGKVTVQEIPQKETTPFYPRSPYGVAKLYAYWIVVNYREAYNLYACNGILFNHESPRRGETFVTRKITRAVAKIMLGQQETVELGNLDSKRDWGHAKDYIEAMWLMLQQEKPDDFVISTGETHSVREFVEASFKVLGVDIIWEGKDVDEVGKDKATGAVRVTINPKYYRPTEVEFLLGDCSKAKKNLSWKPKYSFQELVTEMVQSDLSLMKQNPIA